MHLTQAVGRSEIDRELEAIDKPMSRWTAGRKDPGSHDNDESYLNFAVCNGETERPSR